MIGPNPFELLSQIITGTMPIFLALFIIPFLITMTVGVIKFLARHAENTLAGLVLALEDTRKKKRDEYDAYYDARLADSSAETEVYPNVAYYEDDDLSHLTTHK